MRGALISFVLAIPVATMATKPAKLKATPKARLTRPSKTASRRWKRGQLKKFRATMAARKASNGQQVAEPEPVLA